MNNKKIIKLEVEINGQKTGHTYVSIPKTNREQETNILKSFVEKSGIQEDATIIATEVTRRDDDSILEEIGRTYISMKRLENELSSFEYKVLDVFTIKYEVPTDKGVEMGPLPEEVKE